MAKPRDISEAAQLEREGRFSQKKTGTVVEISRGFNDDGTFHVDVELPKRRRRELRKGEVASDVEFAPREQLLVSEAFAKKVAIGQQLTVTTTIEGA